MDAYEPAPFTTTLIWGVAKKDGSGVVLNTHRYEKTYDGVEIPMMTLSPVEVFFDSTYFKKRYYIRFGPPESPFLEDWVEIACPPFNGGALPLPNYDHQVHEWTAAPPPPKPQPAPVPPPPVPITPPERPVEVIIQPPDQPERPVQLPPEGPPPEHPPRTPPTQLPPPISPRETDMETFRRFMERWGHQLDWVSVNVPLDGGEYVADLEEPWRSLWAKLTQHKADLVFERKGVIYVAEIKPRLSRGAIGEALLAWLMYNRIYKPTKPTKAAVICMTASPLLLQPAGWAGVLVFVTDAIDGTGWWGEVRVRHKMPRTLPSVE